jgi:hypothetical protein
LRVRPEGRFGLPIEPSSEYVYPSPNGSSVLWGNMSRLSLTCLVAFLSTTGAGLAVDTGRSSSIPIFATDDRTGWQLDRTFGVDDLIALPGGGPGPVTFDKAHPYAPPGRPVPTYRVADLSNPILQDWVKPGMKKANDEVIAGGVAYRAHERCWPAGVPTFDTDVVGAPLFIYQRPNEIVVVMESGPEVRHIYLNVPHSANPKPSWYGESVGHYEGGDTLVIDTIGQTDRTFADNYRTPHTTQMHVIERWKLSADGNRVDVSVTVDDPGAFTTPYEGAQRWRRVQVPLEEVICAENNAQDFLGFKVPIPQSSKSDF